MAGRERIILFVVAAVFIAAFVAMARSDTLSASERAEMFAVATRYDFHGLDPKGNVVTVTERKSGGSQLQMRAGGCVEDDPFRTRRYEKATRFLCHGYTTTEAGPMVVLFIASRVSGLLEDRNDTVLEAYLVDANLLDQTRRKHGIALPAPGK